MARLSLNHVENYHYLKDVRVLCVYRVSEFHSIDLDLVVLCSVRFSD